MLLPKFPCNCSTAALNNFALQGISATTRFRDNTSLNTWLNQEGFEPYPMTFLYLNLFSLDT
jgi:hypothetical protein